MWSGGGGRSLTVTALKWARSEDKINKVDPQSLVPLLSCLSLCLDFSKMQSESFACKADATPAVLFISLAHSIVDRKTLEGSKEIWVMV